MESSEAATNRRHNTLLSSGLSKHVRSLLAAETKRCIHLSQGNKGFWGRFSLVPESPPFRHAKIVLPFRNLLGNCYFCIHLFFILYFFISFWLLHIPFLSLSLSVSLSLCLSIYLSLSFTHTHTHTESNYIFSMYISLFVSYWLQLVTIFERILSIFRDLNPKMTLRLVEVALIP